MQISGVNSDYQKKTWNASDQAAKAQAAGTAAESAEREAKAGEVKDTFEHSDRTEEVAYKEPKRLSAEQMKTIQEQQIASFKSMLTSMLGTQAEKDKAARFGLTINADLFSKLTVSKEQQLEAQQAISENGEWGIKAVAGRIMDMAVALSGGDSSKIAVLRNAVEKGFQQAGVQWGQELPGICQDTHKEIDRQFDYWEEHGSLDGYEYGSEE